MDNTRLYHKDVFWDKRFDVQAIELIKSAEKNSFRSGSGTTGTNSVCCATGIIR